MKLTATSESTRLVEYEWTINGVIDGRNTQSIDVDVQSPDVVTVVAKNDCGNWSPRITLDWGVVSDDAYIGVITHEIVKSIGNDEVKFTVPVTNRSDKEKCFYLILRDNTGTEISFAPVPSTQKNKIASGATETMVVTTEWQTAHVGDIAGTTVKIELWMDDVLLFGFCAASSGDPPYELIDSKDYPVPEYEEPDEPDEPDEKPVMPGEDVIPARENLIIVSSDYPEEVGYNETFNMKFTIGNLNAIFSVNAIAQLFCRKSGFITEKSFKVKATEDYILELPGFMYTTNHLDYKLVILQDKIWPLPNEIEDIMNFTVNNKDYIDPDDPSLEFCEQTFKIMYDDVAVPGTVVVNGGEVPVNSTEGGIVTLIKGKEYVAVAYHKLVREIKIFTSCTLEPLVFGLKSEPVPPPGPKPEEENLMLICLAVFVLAVMMFKGA